MADVGTGALGTIVQGAGNGSSPTFSTATYPSSTLANQLLYSSSANTVTGLTTATNGVLITDGTVGIPSISSTLPSAVQGNITSVGALASGSLTTGFTAVNVAQGGTGRTTLTNHGVLVGAATSAITQLAAGSAGQVLQSGGASADPSYSTPTYPSASGSAGVILRSDGTNNVYTTATYPATAGTSGNYLTSNGTNFVSQVPLVISVTVPLTNVNIKALNTTPITIVGAQGAGIVIIPITCTLKLIYGGSNVFSSSGVSTAICYGGSANTNIIFKSNTATFWAQSNNEYFTPLNSTSSSTFNFAYTTVENAAVTISTSAAITGNAAADNTAEINMLYYLISI